MSSKTTSKKSFLSIISGLASIVSATVISLKMAYHGVISVEIAAAIIVGVVAMVAISNAVTKLILGLIALGLFALYSTNGQSEAFSEAIGSIILLLVVVVGLFIVLRGLFK